MRGNQNLFPVSASNVYRRKETREALQEQDEENEESDDEEDTRVFDGRTAAELAANITRRY